MSVKPFLALALSLTAAHTAMAQHAAGDTVLKGSTIEVIQSYKPQVRQAPKPEWTPQLPPADTALLHQNYEVPQQTLYYSYTSEALRPLALGKDSLEIPFPNYIKAGAGNLSTLYLDAGIGNFRGDNYETAIHLHHLSQKGSIQYQQSALSGLEAEGLLHQARYDWHAAIAGERNQFYYYGYNHDLYHISSDSAKQTYTSVTATVDMQNKPDPGSKLSYHPSVTASVYDARFNTSETSFGFTAPFTYIIDSTLQAHVSLLASLTHTHMDSLGGGNNLVELLPGVTLHNGKLNGHGYLGFAVGRGGNFYVLPDIAAYYTIPNTQLLLSGGWMANVHQNTYEQLTTENPYLYHSYPIEQTRRDELFANIAGPAGSHLTYTARASWWNFNNLPTYLKAFSPNQFAVLYDNVSAVSFHGTLRYVESSKWSAGIVGDFYEYYQGTQSYVWNQPSVKIKGDLSVRPLQALTVTGYVAFLGGIHTLSDAGKSITLAPVADIGGNAEYQLASRLGAFVQLSNLLNNKYERWQGYQAYGLNVYVGLRLKF